MAALSNTSNSCSGSTGTTHLGFEIFCVSERSFSVGNDDINFSGDLKYELQQLVSIVTN